MNNFENPSILIGGDWNVVQNFELDTFNYSGRNNQKAKMKLIELMEINDLQDVYRSMHPTERKYTWRSKTPIRMARLDYFLCTPDFLGATKKATIGYGHRSDHSLVSLDIDFINNEKGRGYWKFNPALLHDPVYVDKVKEVIRETSAQYESNGNGEGFSIGYRTFWEVLKMSIRGMTVKYSSGIQRNQNNI